MDRRDGASLTHLAVEFVALAAAGLTAVTLVILWQRERRRLGAAREAVASARARSRSLEVEAARWRAEAEQSLQGLGEAIDRQFDRWGLTAAEREVGLLLLKGLAMKEIAGVRQTSERTARDQARAVYRKAGVSGRAELSAFFLEDLLLPADPGGSPGEPG
ncbi:MAG: DNA-binding response regulator [Deltaproteobacteria bacterium]|nr:MAG: DNA-binding response regulator [Deltaproteobacteria bacterium]